MTALSAREGYRLWAPHYEAETAISYLEDRLVRGLGVSTAGCSLVDVGCGTGRRLRESDAALAVGIDLSVEMLRLATDERVAAADVGHLPFANSSFDVVWCRLMIGHVAGLEVAYRELGRVCRDDGVVVVSDICPEAIEAGHRRTFRDANGEVQEVEHFVHSPDQHLSAAERAGLRLETSVDGCVGPEIESFYARAGRLELYSGQLGLPIVRVFVWKNDTGGVRSAAQRDAERARSAAEGRDGAVS